MGKTIAQFTLTGITDIPVDELREKMTLQQFEEVTILIKSAIGLDISIVIEDIELIDAEEL